MKRLIIVLAIIIAILVVSQYSFTHYNINPNKRIGAIVDKFNSVSVYYNGGVSNSMGRNLSADGYNIGIKYQCVEFVKRYYYERFNHKMPDSYGNAKDFFDKTVADNNLNEKRGLIQFTNGSSSKPQPEDLIVFDGKLSNRFGHVAIITTVDNNSLEIIQQNPGPFSRPRIKICVTKENDKWYIDDKCVLGWLRMPREN